MQKSRKSSLSKISQQKPSIRIIPNQNELTRLARHQKLIQMIHQYTRTTEQEQRLQRMKLNTIKQIDFRYKNSTQNKTYVFPRILQDQNEQWQQKIRGLQRNVLYDLYSQNQLAKDLNPSQFLEISRRVKSLDQVIGVKSQKVIKKTERLQTDLDTQKFSPQLRSRMKRSATISKQLSPQKLILPVLGKKLQNLKTQNPQSNKNLIEKLVSKKLITQAYQPLIIKSEFKLHQRHLNFKRK